MQNPRQDLSLVGDEMGSYKAQISQMAAPPPKAQV
jgi:hypothetical protein